MKNSDSRLITMMSQTYAPQKIQTGMSEIIKVDDDNDFYETSEYSNIESDEEEDEQKKLF